MQDARTHGRGLHPLGLLLVLAAAYLAFAYLLTPNRPFPYYPDDFSFLSGAFADMGWHWKRPVSANIIFLVAAGGFWLSYAVLAASTVVVAWLAMLLVSRVFGVGIGLLPAAAASAVLFSHAAAFEHGKYLGLMTNLVSHGLGLASLLLLWHGWRRARVAWCVVAALVYLASAFAKEDFLLPPLLLLGLLRVLDHHEAGAPGRRTERLSHAARLVVSLLFVAVPAGAMAWSAVDRNPFVAGLFSPDTSSPSYAVELAPAALWQAFATLFVGYTAVATLLAACAVLAMARLPGMRMRLAWLVATIVALALPYAVIPHNMPGYRAYAWLPWMAAIIGVALALAQAALDSQAGRGRARRALPLVAALAVAAIAVAAHREARTELALRYAAGEAVNRRMLEVVEAHRDAIAAAPVVGLAGLDGPSPWCGNGTLYLRYKRRLAQQWIVFAAGPTPCYQVSTPGGRKPRYELGLTVAPPAQACAMGAMPVLAFEPDGHGRLASAQDVCVVSGAAPAQP
ncbi:hypothetical protein [Luteimonas sp. MC1750]|uniref:hypothetical protein n=1 Tax=Luteimonas sp. MC1750 TaxID=2799326 RepID=UPI0018F0EEAF|nr:hypothetical protein [Luteimonas sp. MC1750]MBJ6983463.1 hypothetical protein [Luteimonas sp. MC1750]QQO06315.1 hypothetical protein JGR68_02380 [Luteimonas sp. MC1750]